MTTLATLKSDVEAWFARDDLTARIPSFVRICEAEIRRKVRPRDMEQTATLTVSARSTPLPDGFLSLRALTKVDDYDRVLEYLTPEKIREEGEWQDSDGPTAYTIEGDNLIVAPAPTSAIDFDIVYLKAYDALSADTDTNWLLTNHFDVYLYGCLWAGAVYLEDIELEQKYMALFERAVESLNREQKLSRFGGSSIIRRGVSTP